MSQCELCGAAIEGVPFALSNLDEEQPRILEVCQQCAECDYFCLEHCDVELEVHRDDYIEADRDRLLAAVEDALYRLEELGWICERMRLHARKP